MVDELLKRQSTIQKKLAHKHLNQRHMVLYDITSVYFEGAYVIATDVEQNLMKTEQVVSTYKSLSYVLK